MLDRFIERDKFTNVFEPHQLSQTYGHQLRPSSKTSFQAHSMLSIDYKIFGLQNKFCWRGATIAQRIRLRVPSCSPGSSPKHTIYTFFIYSNCAIFVMWKERKYTKRGQVWPILKQILVDTQLWFCNEH